MIWSSHVQALNGGAIGSRTDGLVAALYLTQASERNGGILSAMWHQSRSGYCFAWWLLMSLTCVINFLLRDEDFSLKRSQLRPSFVCEELKNMSQFFCSVICIKSLWVTNEARKIFNYDFTKNSNSKTERRKKLQLQIPQKGLEMP